MSPLLPAVPVSAPPAGPGINRPFVVERNGGPALRRGGGRGPAPDVVAVTVVAYYGGSDAEIGTPDIPEGIDYALWSQAVRPASRDGFEDTLDFVDLLDD